jgi:hypothetical protein
MFSIRNNCIAAAVAGIASHHAYFIRGEHHLAAPKLMRLYFFFAVLLFFGHLRDEGTTYQDGAVSSALILVVYTLALFLSITIYRLAFHQLRGYPGPFLAKITKLWHAFQVRNADQYLLLERLHEQYGDFVRTGALISTQSIECVHVEHKLMTTWFLGPNEIALFTPEAVHCIHGPGTKCTKSAMYDIFWPYIALTTTRSNPDHEKRRRIWNRGLSIKGMDLNVIISL